MLVENQSDKSFKWNIKWTEQVDKTVGIHSSVNTYEFQKQSPIPPTHLWKTSIFPWTELIIMQIISRLDSFRQAVLCKVIQMKLKKQKWKELGPGRISEQSWIWHISNTADLNLIKEMSRNKSNVLTVHEIIRFSTTLGKWMSQ